MTYWLISVESRLCTEYSTSSTPVGIGILLLRTYILGTVLLPSACTPYVDYEELPGHVTSACRRTPSFP